jgi:hypothetical protein
MAANPGALAEGQVLMIDRLRYVFPEDPGGPLHENEVIEVPLLLPGWQMEVLESAAHDRGLTAAEMVRHLLRSFVLEMQKKMPGIRGPDGRSSAALERPTV